MFLTSDFQKVQLFLQNLSLILTISNYCLCISVTLKKLFNERTDVIGFLQKISTHTDPSTGNQLCDAPGLTFALRLAAILLNSLHLQLGTESGTSSDEAGVEGCDVKMEGHTWKHYVDVISDLTEQLLVGAQQLSYWEQGSVRMAYFVAAKALIHHRFPSNVCQEAGKNKHSHMGRVVARPILVMGNKSIFFRSLSKACRSVNYGASIAEVRPGFQTVLVKGPCNKLNGIIDCSFLVTFDSLYH